MRNTAVALAKIEARTADRRAVADVLGNVVANPVLVGLGAIALNYAAYKAGAYKGAPVRSMLGGPVWFTLGNALPPDVEQYARYETFIMTCTAALALSGGVKGLAGGFTSLTGLLKGVST